MGTLENTFSWSNSRASTFRRCQRAYWWQYYGSWGGWERSSQGETREAYVLKNLSSRWAWVGVAVHEWIEGLLKRMKSDAERGALPFDQQGPDIDHEVESLTEHMRFQYRQSLSGQYRDNPKRNFGLLEHEYQEGVSREEWKRTSEKARDALRGFLESDIFSTIAASNPADWFAIEHLDQFQLDGVGIWAVPDFARHVGASATELYDWKTGAVKPEKSRLQMACYTLYMHLRHGIEPGTLTSHLVYLGPKVEVHDFRFTTTELEEARSEIRASMDAMRARLANVESNDARQADYPMTDRLSYCASCNFRRLCGR